MITKKQFNLGETGFSALFLIIFVVIILIVILLLTTKFPTGFPNTGDIPITPFISASGTKLYANGQLYQFTGVNAFNLGTLPGSNAGCGGPVNDLDKFFSVLRPNSMVRMWAFQGSMATNVTTKQTDWTGLDRVVAAALKNGIKLDLVLGDQAGTCDDGLWRDKSWYSTGYTQVSNGSGLTPLSYINYVKLVVTRYKDSTAVGMWEPINEPEPTACTSGQGSACYANLTCNDEAGSTQALRSFFDVVGGQIKAIDKNHLVSSGVIGNGQCGAVYYDYQFIHQSSGIDVASYHDYGNENQPMPGDPWNGLQSRLTMAKNLNKPLIIGEVGMLAIDNSLNCMSYSSRKDKLKAKMDAQFSAGIAGFMPWNLSSGPSNFCNYDIAPNDPTIALLQNYPVSMGLSTPRPSITPSPTPTPTPKPTPSPTPSPTPVPDTQPPTAPTNLTATGLTSTQVTLTWGASADNVGVVRYDFFRNNNYFTSVWGTIFTNTNLTPGITYSYQVKGRDNANNSSESSNRVTITTPINP